MGGQPGGQMGGPVAPQPAAPAPEPVPLAPIPAQHIEIQVKRKTFFCDWRKLVDSHNIMN